jgi:RNA recognition motif-containing protein
MAAAVQQTVDPSHPSIPTPTAGPSKLAATVQDEDAEMKTESGAAANADVKAKDDSEEKDEDPNKIPDNACETLYIQNLNEKVRIPGECVRRLSPSVSSRCRRRANLRSVMTQTLASLFKPYRPVLPVVAHRNVRMRGQAFVSFTDIESANRARKEVNEFPLYGKAMVRLDTFQIMLSGMALRCFIAVLSDKTFCMRRNADVSLQLISFAKGRSESVVQKLEGDEALEQHKTQRLKEKSEFRALGVPVPPSETSLTGLQRRNAETTP